MIEIIRRGGEGAASWVDLCAAEAVSEGEYAQGFQYFGPERMGAVVMAFLRMSDKPIKLCSEIYESDAVVVDTPLLDRADQTVGLKMVV